MGPLHGYGIARRIEQTSGDLLSLNYGTLYPALLKLEQEGSIASEWGASENNRKAKFYRLTRAGRKQLEQEAREWERPPPSWRAFSRPVRSRHEDSARAGMRLAGIFSKDRREHDIAAEIESHLQMQTMTICALACLRSTRVATRF